MKTLATIFQSDFEDDLSAILVVLYLSGCFVVMLSFAFNWGNLLVEFLSGS
jgi:hypothetical protein